jgi:glycosyltransferase involved in cell wall biosynthesis
LRIYRLWKLKRELRPDYCISQLESSDYLNVLTRCKDEKTICLIQCSMIFNHDIKGPSAWLRKKLLMPLTYKKADAIVSVSSAIKVEFEQYFGVNSSKIHIIYNFINLDEVVAKSKEPVNDSISAVFRNSYCFVTAGRLTAQKNQAALIVLLSGLKKRSEEGQFKLFILGDGELREQLITLAESYGLNVYTTWSGATISTAYDIFFMGFDKNPFKYFARAKWFIFSSLWEGLPLVLVEAMASGVPIISSDCPTGPADILGGPVTKLEFTSIPRDARFGVLMPMIPDSGSYNVVDSWCEKILSIYHNDQLRTKYIALLPGRLHEFSMNYAMNQWFKILQEL